MPVRTSKRGNRCQFLREFDRNAFDLAAKASWASMPVWAACGSRFTLDSGRFRGSSSRLLFRLLLLGLRTRGCRLVASQRMLAEIGLMRRLVDFPKVDAVFPRSVFVAPR